MSFGIASNIRINERLTTTIKNNRIMEATDRINNPTKEQYIERKIEDIKKSIQEYGYDKISTCNSFSYGWSREDYLYMDDVASKIRQIGVTVRKEMKFGVMDYYFS